MRNIDHPEASPGSRPKRVGGHGKRVLDTRPGRGDASLCCKKEDWGAMVVFPGSTMAAAVVHEVLHVLVTECSVTGEESHQIRLGLGSLVVRCLCVTRT